MDNENRGNSRLLIALLVVGLIVLFNVFGDRPETEPRPPTRSLTPAESYTATPASGGQLALVREAVEGGLRVNTAYAVRSRHHQEAYYVAAQMYGPGLEDGAVGVWLISGPPQNPGVILSVNHMAAEFSAPMLARDTDAAASMSDPEAAAVARHAERNP